MPDSVAKLSPPYEEYDTALLGGFATLTVLQVAVVCVFAFKSALALLPLLAFLVVGQALDEEELEVASPLTLPTPENGKAAIEPALTPAMLVRVSSEIRGTYSGKGRSARAEAKPYGFDPPLSRVLKWDVHAASSRGRRMAPVLVVPDSVAKLSPPYEEYDTALLGGFATLTVRQVALVCVFAFKSALALLPLLAFLVVGQALDEDELEVASPLTLPTPENGKAAIEPALTPAMLGGTHF
ncbi:uncharacterized protein EDB91DRAFT_1256727 [Suillus paluster]|uniref:uncharacterized protein n=1 Tax=Suillus paluster TaxID=48578 RepID=UPI001B876550|nr:uncharacterized protein EDB91DRAFT_1256727 [Suillus paluster]KAG1720971.1 hypothetical protein EDB91DRAFT_1256727 [Suillus paluster]